MIYKKQRRSDMSISVSFLKKQYTFPKDILTYIDILNLTEDIQASLFKSLLEKVHRSQTPVINNEDLHNDMKKQAGRFIEKLCENDIYNKTVDEYVFDNNGYKTYCEINKEGIQALAQFLSEEMISFRDGINNAEMNATSNITGSGLQVYTSSFLTLAATSAMEYSILKKQTEEADKQYRNEVQAISDKGAAIREDKERCYIKNTYIPNMEKALTLFSFEMMDKYIKHLTEAGKFDSNALNFVDIKKSVDLLENLKHTTNKSAVYEQSFLACPYNFNLYLNLVESDMLDKETFDTAEVFGQGSKIVNFLKSRIFDTDCKNSLTDSIKRITKYVSIYSDITNTNKDDIYHQVANKKYKSVKEAYNDLKQKISAPDKCSSLIKVDENSLEKINEEYINILAQKEVVRIISNDDFNTLQTICGYVNLLNEITLDNQKFDSKSSLDTFYIKKLTESVTTYAEECKEKILKKKEQKEALSKEKRKRTKRIIIVLSIIILVIILLAVYIKAIKPSITYNSAIKAMDSKNYSDAITAFESLDDYSDSKVMIQECYYREANDFYQSGNNDEAINIFNELGNYSDSSTMIMQIKYDEAEKLLESHQYHEAINAFSEINNFKDSTDKIKAAYSDWAEKIFNNGEYLTAIETMKKGYPNNIAFFDKCYYKYGEQALLNEDYATALDSFTRIKSEDVTELINYVSGMNYYNNADYMRAVIKFEACKNSYEDIISACLSKLYSMVTENIKNDNYKDIGKYLDFLIERNYKDCKLLRNKVKEMFKEIEGKYIADPRKSEGYDITGSEYIEISTSYESGTVKAQFFRKDIRIAGETVFTESNKYMFADAVNSIDNCEIKGSTITFSVYFYGNYVCNKVK